MAETNEMSAGGSGQPYLVYAAGEMFDIHDLMTNVQLKEMVWEASGGRYALHLPQSKEPREMEHPNLAAHIRNMDLRSVLRADLVLVRFDGLELDSGTVVEFMFAKFLGKPVVILRRDSRRSAAVSFDEPYNLMAKSWPRTVSLHANALTSYIRSLTEMRAPEGETETAAQLLQAEQAAARRGMEETVEQIIEGLDKARGMPSPYPPEDQERVYFLSRLIPGSGFSEMVTEDEIAEIVARLRVRGTL